MLPWLQLLRLPTVFTALADVLCGFFVAAAVLPAGAASWEVLPLLLLSSAGLYLGGMVLNDVFDSALDTVERPERPIPSGCISRRSAALFGAMLMLIGLAAAGAAWVVAGRVGHTLLIAGLIAAAVVTYDAVLKSTVAGPVSMATCRFLNLALGASTAVTSTGAVLSWQQPVLGAALGLGVYIIGVTWFARNEAGNASRFGLVAGLFVASCGILVSAFATLSLQDDRTIAIIAGVQFAVIIVVTVMRGRTAILSGQPPLLQRTVGKMLLWIIVFDAVVVFAVTGQAWQEGLILLLVAPAMLLRKRIPMS